jgi:Phage tail lysozyme
VATEREVYDALVGKGFSMAQAAGIMGNIQNESTFNQEAIGDGGQSFGLVQWYTPSYPFAPSLVTGHLAADLANQMDHIVNASHGVSMGGSAETVAGNWASQFERCVGCQPGGPQWSSRVANAGRIFTQAKTGHWPTGPGTPGGPGPNPPPTPGTPPGVSSPGLLQELGNVWGIPFNFWTSAAAPVTGIVTATEDVAQALAGISNVFSMVQSLFGAIAWFFVPSHIVRVISFVLGVPLVGFGIFNLSRTGQPYSMKLPVVGAEVPASGGNLAPAIGIAEVTAGAVLLFIAFHNLPATVVDLPSLLTFVQQEIAKPGAKGGGGIQ